jgi:hypothetical protein
LIASLKVMMNTEALPADGLLGIANFMERS